MDFELTDEQRLVKETARAFTDNEIVARARENDRTAHFDLELVQKIADQGYLDPRLDRDQWRRFQLDAWAAYQDTVLPLTDGVTDDGCTGASNEKSEQAYSFAR